MHLQLNIVPKKYNMSNLVLGTFAKINLSKRSSNNVFAFSKQILVARSATKKNLEKICVPGFGHLIK